jgi:hypothetical protein
MVSKSQQGTPEEMAARVAMMEEVKKVKLKYYELCLTIIHNGNAQAAGYKDEHDALRKLLLQGRKEAEKLIEDHEMCWM